MYLTGQELLYVGSQRNLKKKLLLAFKLNIIYYTHIIYWVVSNKIQTSPTIVSKLLLNWKKLKTFFIVISIQIEYYILHTYYILGRFKQNPNLTHNCI